MQRDIFISYSRRDIGLVKQIKEEIEKSIGIHCWMDINGIESGSPRFTKDLEYGLSSLILVDANSQMSLISCMALLIQYHGQMLLSTIS